MCFSDGDVFLILSALKFSAEKHRQQRRKDNELSPYINHPIEIAELLWRVGGVRDTRVIAAALLHDSIEDTETNPEELESLFGADVLSMVLEVTDDKNLPKQDRKRLQIEHAPALSHGAKLIKLCDKISNVRDVTYSPPKNWPLERKIDYLDWSERVINGLRGANPALEALFDQVLEEGRTRLGAKRQQENQ